ncbi:Ms4527A family Cys-rich leader peptide [Mycobacterium sp.]|uniref:Ms4527A family Cys-rich leader peptide n=1 Tax=Mycobacterium sp. TaxID=1785 RepID=UPI0039C9F689
MPNGPPGLAIRSGSAAGAVRTVMHPVSQTAVTQYLARTFRTARKISVTSSGTERSPGLAAGFAHCERKSPPVRAGASIRGTIGDVIAARSFQRRVSLVARRHVDFKRVCTCCCLP